MPQTILTSREANQNFSRVKNAALTGHVIVTERGKPKLAILDFEEYQRLTRRESSILEMLAMPEMEDIEFEIPERSKDTLREIDLS